VRNSHNCLRKNALSAVLRDSKQHRCIMRPRIPHEKHLQPTHPTPSSTSALLLAFSPPRKLSPNQHAPHPSFRQAPQRVATCMPTSLPRSPPIIPTVPQRLRRLGNFPAGVIAPASSEVHRSGSIGGISASTYLQLAISKGNMGKEAGVGISGSEEREFLPRCCH
jgi:hypothetical protein